MPRLLSPRTPVLPPLLTSLVGRTKMPRKESRSRGELCTLRNEKVGYGAIDLKREVRDFRLNVPLRSWRSHTKTDFRDDSSASQLISGVLSVWIISIKIIRGLHPTLFHYCTEADKTISESQTFLEKVNTALRYLNLFSLFLTALEPSIYSLKGPSSFVSKVTTNWHPTEPHLLCNVKVLACFCMDFQLRLLAIVNHTITPGTAESLWNWF